MTDNLQEDIAYKIQEMDKDALFGLQLVMSNYREKINTVAQDLTDHLGLSVGSLLLLEELCETIEPEELVELADGFAEEQQKIKDRFDIMQHRFHELNLLFTSLMEEMEKFEGFPRE